MPTILTIDDHSFIRDLAVRLDLLDWQPLPPDAPFETQAQYDTVSYQDNMPLNHVVS